MSHSNAALTSIDGILPCTLLRFSIFPPCALIVPFVFFPLCALLRLAMNSVAKLFQFAKLHNAVKLYTETWNRNGTWRAGFDYR